MMAEFKGVWCSEPGVVLERFVPEEADKFLLHIQAFFGPKNSEGSESFDFILCTPKALAEEVGDRLIFMRHYILTSKFDYSALIARFEKLASSVSGKEWHEIATTLARYGRWEFEDYRS